MNAVDRHDLKLNLDLLREVAGSTLPVSILDVAKVRQIKALREAGLLLTLVYKVDRHRECARVLALTPAGRAALTDAAFAAFAANDGTVERWIPARHAGQGGD
ncbi:MAG: hypothetical protein V4625_19215 [Pseudomonadota bacterium]